MSRLALALLDDVDVAGLPAYALHDNASSGRLILVGRERPADPRAARPQDALVQLAQLRAGLDPPTPLAAALAEYGRIVRTNFLLGLK